MSKNAHDEEFYSISPNVVYRRGGKRGLVVETETKRIYWLNGTENRIFGIIAEDGNSSAVLAKAGGSRVRRILQKFLDQGLMFKNASRVYVDSPDPALRIRRGTIERKMAKIVVQELIVRINAICGLDCALCSNKDYEYCGCIRNSSLRRLPIKDLARAVTDVQLFYCDEVTLIGGDPLLYPELKAVIKLLQDRRIKRINILTNLSVLNENSAKILKESGVHIKVPFFSTNQAGHDKMTGKRGSYGRTLANMRSLRDDGLKVETLLWFDIYSKRPDPYILDNTDNIGIETTNVKFYIGPKKSIFKKGILASNCLHIKNVLANDTIFENKIKNVCAYGKLMLDFEGRIFGCAGAKKPIGNIRRTSLGEVLRKGKMDRYWFVRGSFKICKACEFDMICRSCNRLNGTAYDVRRNTYCRYNPERGEWE